MLISSLAHTSWEIQQKIIFLEDFIMAKSKFNVFYNGESKDHVGRIRYEFSVDIEKREWSNFIFALNPEGLLVMGSKDFLNLDKELQTEIVLDAKNKIPVK